MREELIRDVMAQVGSIHIMNCPNAIGYLFNPNKGEYAIATGMYCSNYKEIDHNKWTYFFSFIYKHITHTPGSKECAYFVEHKKHKFYHLYKNKPDSYLGFGENNDTYLFELPDDYKVATLQ